MFLFYKKYKIKKLEKKITKINKKISKLINEKQKNLIKMNKLLS
jgi:hypothetical protein